jgi:arginine dihydrolase
MKHTRIKKVLMCKPLYFETLDYVINPWMKPGTIMQKKAMREWQHLVHIYKKRKIIVEVIDQQRGSPDMVFAADQGILQGKTVLLSRFWCDERKKETGHYRKWFEEHGYTIIYLPENICFEGNGDAAFWNDKFFIGIGYRADKKTCKAVGKLLDVEVIPLEIVDPKFYHLDVGFFSLDHETAFYYPPAFSKKSRGVLKKLVPNLVELSDDEAYGFCANSIVINHQVIHQKNKTFCDKLNKFGYSSIQIDAGEFMKSGGGIHCLTNILEETT